jgi:uncharacterized membrane protein
VLLFGGAGWAILGARSAGDAMTEFALYNADGRPEFYPREIVVGESTPVVLEITNREGVEVTYWVRVVASGQETKRLDGIQLADGERWSGVISLTLYDVGERVPIEIELYRIDDNDRAKPYRTLQLTVAGVEPGN